LVAGRQLASWANLQSMPLYDRQYGAQVSVGPSEAAQLMTTPQIYMDVHRLA
jgi:hypothetical protein